MLLLIKRYALNGQKLLVKIKKDIPIIGFKYLKIWLSVREQN